MKAEVKIEVERNRYGDIWYTVTTPLGGYGLGESLQEALTQLERGLPYERGEGGHEE